MINIPASTYRSFKKHFIKQVFAEVRFVPHSLPWDDAEKILKEAFSSIGFPHFHIGFDATLKLIGPQNGNAPGVEVDSRKNGLIISSADESASIEIRQDRCIFIANKYEDFDQFYSNLDKCLKVLAIKLNLNSFTWFGLRKLNEFTVSTSEVGYKGEGLRDIFFTPLNRGIFSSQHAEQGDNSYVLRDDRRSMVIRTGFAKRAEDPGYIVSLDIDVNNSFENPIGIDDLKVHMKSANELLFSVFCFAIADDLMRAMDDE